MTSIERENNQACLVPTPHKAIILGTTSQTGHFLAFFVCQEGDRFLMCSKKRPNNATSNYLISMRAGDLDRNSTNFLGKLRANFVGTEFQVRRMWGKCIIHLINGERLYTRQAAPYFVSYRIFRSRCFRVPLHSSLVSRDRGSECMFAFCWWLYRFYFAHIHNHHGSTVFVARKV